MKERSREVGSSPRTAEEMFMDCSGRRTDAVHALTNERERSSKVSSISINLGYPQRPISRGKEVSIVPSLYLQIEAPVKHKHYRLAGKKRKEMLRGTSPGHKLSSNFKSVFLQEIVYSKGRVPSGAEEKGERKSPYLLSLERCFFHSA